MCYGKRKGTLTIPDVTGRELHIRGGFLCANTGKSGSGGGKGDQRDGKVVTDTDSKQIVSGYFLGD